MIFFIDFIDLFRTKLVALDTIDVTGQLWYKIEAYDMRKVWAGLAMCIMNHSLDADFRQSL